MNRKIIWLLILLMPLFCEAQFSKLISKAKSKIDQRVDNKVDQAMDKKLDEVEGKPSTNATVDNNKAQDSKSENAQEKADPVKAYSKFDFVPGEKIIYAEDFSQDAIGELPLTWNSSGKGELMTLSTREGKWLRVFQNNTYLTGNKKTLGENFTIEFDLMYFFEPRATGYLLPGWSVGLFSAGDIDPADNQFLSQRSDTNSTEIKFGFGSYAMAQVESKWKRAWTFRSDLMKMGQPTETFNSVVHYSMQVQKTRLRVWIDENKIFDIPRAINVTSALNGLFLTMDGSNYKDAEIGLFISNIRIATGLPDTRHKLVDEGKFSTTGILFDVNAATIKPESNGVIKEIADVLKNNPGMRVNIIGHTDSDGSDVANLALSKKRADAVKEALVRDWNIDTSSLETDGKGETQPVGDNKTKEGKAQNRRVEFIKK